MLVRTPYRLRAALTWLCLLLHLLVGAGMAQGAGLCLASDGRLTLEPLHAQLECIATHNIHEPLPSPAIDWDVQKRSCKNIPIYMIGSNKTKPAPRGIAPLASQIESLFDSAALLDRSPIGPVYPSSITPLFSRLHSLRTVILLV